MKKIIPIALIFLLYLTSVSVVESSSIAGGIQFAPGDRSTPISNSTNHKIIWYDTTEGLHGSIKDQVHIDMKVLTENGPIWLKVSYHRVRITNIGQGASITQSEQIELSFSNVTLGGLHLDTQFNNILPWLPTKNISSTEPQTVKNIDYIAVRLESPTVLWNQSASIGFNLNFGSRNYSFNKSNPVIIKNDLMQGKVYSSTSSQANLPIQEISIFLGLILTVVISRRFRK